MKENFLELLKNLDDDLTAENFNRIRTQELSLKPVEIKLMGQFALLLLLSNEDLNATADFDAVIRGDLHVKNILKKRLLDHNLVLDEDAELIKMPKGTEWAPFYKGNFLSVVVAKPEYVIASKCEFKRKKDKIQLKKLLHKHPEWRATLKSLSISMEWLDEQ